MTRTRKRKGPGYDFNPAVGKRPVDAWRAWAAVPLPAIKVTTSEPPLGPGPYDPVCTLWEDGVVVGTWRNSDAPWLFMWLTTRLSQLHGSWHLAREALTLTAGQERAGKKLAEARKAEATERDRKIVNAAKQIIAVDGPMPDTKLAERIAERIGGSAGTICKKLPRLLRE